MNTAILIWDNTTPAPDLKSKSIAPPSEGFHTEEGTVASGMHEGNKILICKDITACLLCDHNPTRIAEGTSTIRCEISSG